MPYWPGSCTGKRLLDGARNTSGEATGSLLRTERRGGPPRPYLLYTHAKPVLDKLYNEKSVILRNRWRQIKNACASQHLQECVQAAVPIDDHPVLLEAAVSVAVACCVVGVSTPHMPTAGSHPRMCTYTCRARQRPTTTATTTPRGDTVRPRHDAAACGGGVHVKHHAHGARIPTVAQLVELVVVGWVEGLPSGSIRVHPVWWRPRQHPSTVSR